MLAPGQRREAAIAGLVIARRRIDQHDLELVLGDARGDFLDLVFVAERELDGAKTGVRRFAEPFEERNLVEEKRKVGGKARHAQAERTQRRAGVAFRWTRRAGGWNPQAG